MEDNQEFIPPTDATAVESAVEDVQFIPPTDATAVEEITDPDVKKKRVDRTDSGRSFTRSWRCFGRTYTISFSWYR